MRAPNLTLFKYSLMLDNKHWLTYLVRFLQLGLILLALLPFVATISWTTAPGLRFFQMISGINLFFIFLTGVVFFPSVVTEEKEAGNLQLLLMTGLNKFTLLLSKSTSKLVQGIFLLLIQLPFTVLSVTLGGISLHQITAVYMMLFAYVFFVCNLGLLTSVMCSDSKKAGSLSLVLMLSTLLLRSGWVKNPFAKLEDILRTGYAGNILDSTVIIYTLSGGLLFAGSLLIFDYFTKGHSVSDEVLMRQASVKTHSWSSFFQVSRIRKHPFFWKGFYFCSSGKFGIFMRVFLLSGIFIAMKWLSSRNVMAENESMATFLIFSGLLVLLVDFGSYISKMMEDEFKGKTLGMLLMLPLSPSRLFFSMMSGFIPNVIPVTVYILIGFVIYPQIIYSPGFWMALFFLVYYTPLIIYILLYASLGNKTLVWGAVIFSVIAIFATCAPLILIFPLVFTPILHGLLKGKLQNMGSIAENG